MKIITTSGKEWNLDFETEEGYKQMREMYIHLQKQNFFKVINDEKEKIEDLVQSLTKNFDIDIDVIRMVCNHYYKQLKSNLDAGKIDDIDMAIQLGKLVVLELEKWK